MENFSTKEKINLIREKIQHEDNLIINRINWLIVTQAGLLTCFFSTGIQKIKPINYAIIGIAILLCVLFGNSIHFCDLSLKKLRNLYKKYKKGVVEDSSDDILFIGYSSKNSSRFTLLRKIAGILLPSYILPILLALFWIIILLWVNSSK